jgi:hypothetical protein
MDHRKEALMSEIFRLLELQKEFAKKAKMTREEADAYHARSERIRDLVNHLSADKSGGAPADD